MQTYIHIHIHPLNTYTHTQTNTAGALLIATPPHTFTPQPHSHLPPNHMEPHQTQLDFAATPAPSAPIQSPSPLSAYPLVHTLYHYHLVVISRTFSGCRSVHCCSSNRTPANPHEHTNQHTHNPHTHKHLCTRTYRYHTHHIHTRSNYSTHQHTRVLSQRVQAGGSAHCRAQHVWHTHTHTHTHSRRTHTYRYRHRHTTNTTETRMYPHFYKILKTHERFSQHSTVVCVCACVCLFVCVCVCVCLFVVWVCVWLLSAPICCCW